MVLRFANCELDLERRELRRDGATVTVPPKVLDVLIYFSRAGDRIVTRGELREAIWTGVSVSEGALRYAIKEARRAIGDDGARQGLIRTVRGRGFRFLPAMSTPPSAARSGQPPVEPFVGRREALAALESELDAVLESGGRLVLLEGEPGIGKSSLLREVGSRARRRGFRVFGARGVEGTTPLAYWPWTQLFRQLLDAGDGFPIPTDAAGVLAQTMPELRHLLPTFSASSLPELRDAREAHFRLLDAAGRTWRAAARQVPLLLTFDDLHDADAATLRLLAHVMREFEESRVLVLAASREPSAGADPDRTGALAELLRGPRARRVALGGLARSEVAQLVTALGGDTTGEAALDELMRRTNGNPFFVRAIVASEDGRAEPSPSLPETVRQAVLRHLDMLPARCRETLARAAVLGLRFEFSVLVALVDRSSEDVVADLDQAAAVGVLRSDPIQPWSYEFAHALIAEALRGSLAPSELRDLHAACARALEARAARRGAVRLQIAHHLVRAVPTIKAEDAIAACRLAAREARSRAAHDEVVRGLEWAVELTAEGSVDPAIQLELLLELAEAHLRSTQPEAARETSIRAARLARELGDAPALARAALGFAGSQGDARTDPAVVALLEEAAAALDPSQTRLRARVLGRLAEAIYYGPGAARAAALSREAVSLARACGDPVTLSLTLQARYWSTWGPDNLDEREEGARELLELGREAGEAEIEHSALAFGLANALEQGDRHAVEKQFAAYAELARRERRLLFDWHLEHFRTLRHLLDRNLAAAEGAFQRASRLGKQSRYSVAFTWFAIQLYGLRRAQGRLAELEPAMRKLAREYPGTPWRLALACWEVSAGREEEGWAAFREYLGEGVVRVGRDLTFLVHLWYLAELCAALEAKELAPILERALEPYAERHVQVGLGMLYLGPVTEALARVAQAQGHTAEARAYRTRAQATTLCAPRASWAGQG